MPPLADPNLDIAALLLDLSEVYRPAPKFWGYKHASRSIRRHPEFLSDLTEKDILKIPGVGPASLRVVREFLDAGASSTVDRLVRESGKANEIDARRALRRHFLSAAMVRKVLSEPKRGALKREDYLGDFQMHSRGSDGADTIEMLAKGCIKRGYRCMCVTDHSYGLPIAGGMKMDEMRAQAFTSLATRAAACSIPVRASSPTGPWCSNGRQKLHTPGWPGFPQVASSIAGHLPKY